MDPKHNFTAPPAAHLAMVILGEQYSQQRGGVFDFWLSLSDSDRRRYMLGLNEALKVAKKLKLSIDDMVQAYE